MADDPIRVFTALVTYPDNFAEAEKTLADLRESDWGDVPHMFIQPSNWSKSIASAAANYKRALIAAAEADCDFTLILEDDVRVCRHLRHNLSTIPIVARRQCDYLSLFIPDLIADPLGVGRIAPRLPGRQAPLRRPEIGVGEAPALG